MRVFVVGTGRCGTSTFYQACRHVANFTAGHESAARTLGLYPYPDGHIEVAAHLSMAMGRVMRAHQSARWVHLIRDRDDAVRSLASQSQVQLDSFARHWFQAFQADPNEVAAAFYDCVNANIERMLETVPPQRSKTLQLERIGDQWQEFWDWIGAEGDFEASLAEWERRYNSSDKMGRDEWVSA